MSSRTKSVDEPPTWKPTLIPPTEYIAGVDHLPSSFRPLRQSKGPRPPLPPMPKPNFFTLGRMSTQLAFDNEVSEMSVGFQVGGSSTDFVLLLMTPKVVNQILNGKTKM